MVTRVSTYSNHLLTIDSLQKRQSSLSETQRSISSGVKYDTFAQVALIGETRRVSDFNSALERINTYDRNNKLMQTRLETMEKNLGALQDINTEALKAMTTERSGVQDVLPLSQQLKALLQKVEDNLNSNAGGRYLFSGAQTNVRPVNGLTVPNIDSSGDPNDNYYLGDGANLAQAASDDVVIDYGVRANDPAFQKLIGAMHLAIRAESNGSDRDLATAIDMANAAQVEMNGVRNKIADNLAVIETTNTDHSNFKSYFQQTVGGIVGTDVAEASIQLSMDQAILTASFQSFARVSGLSLTQFLR